MADKLTLDFLAKIDAMMKENVPEGYRFAVHDSEQVVGGSAGGYSRQAIDPPAYAAKIDDRENIASMSKLITAAAVLAVLQQKNLSPDSVVAPFLPADWTLHDDVKKLTFRQFMTHHSGFYWEETAFAPKQDGTSYAEIKSILAQKPYFTPGSTYSYRNVNLALFRIVLPLLESYDRFTKKTSFIIRGAPEQAFAARYKAIVNEYVLQPSGVAPADCTSGTLVPPASPNGRPAPLGSRLPILAYHFKKPSQKGYDLGDRTLIAGAEGWSLSVRDVAKVLHTLLYTEVIISEKSRAAMKIQGQGAGCGMNSDAPVAGSAVHSHGAYIPLEPGAEGAAFSGWFYCFDKTKLIVVALSNAGHDPQVVSDKGNWDARLLQIYAGVYK